MANELPYLASYKNVTSIFKKIKTAKVPEVFTTPYLADTLGFKSSTDRALIALLKTLKFLDPSGKPTASYSLLKNDKSAAIALASAVRTAYEPLFSADERANELSQEELKGLVSQVAGSDNNTTVKIVGTFRGLCSIADFSAEPKADTGKEKGKEKEATGGKDADLEEDLDQTRGKRSLRPDFHYNIQVHLPSNGSEDTYLNIFNAIRKVFK